VFSAGSLFPLETTKNVSTTAGVASRNKFSAHLKFITFTTFNRLTKIVLYPIT